jgi:hypothetical protein
LLRGYRGKLATYALTIAAQKKRLERLGQGFSCSGTLSRSKAGRLTYCRQAVPACFGDTAANSQRMR